MQIIQGCMEAPNQRSASYLNDYSNRIQTIEVCNMLWTFMFLVTKGLVRWGNDAGFIHYCTLVLKKRACASHKMTYTKKKKSISKNISDLFVGICFCLIRQKGTISSHKKIGYCYHIKHAANSFSIKDIPIYQWKSIHNIYGAKAVCRTAALGW